MNELIDEIHRAIYNEMWKATNNVIRTAPYDVIYNSIDASIDNATWKSMIDMIGKATFDVGYDATKEFTEEL